MTDKFTNGTLFPIDFRCEWSWFNPRTALEPLMARVFEKISRDSEPSLQNKEELLKGL